MDGEAGGPGWVPRQIRRARADRTRRGARPRARAREMRSRNRTEVGDATLAALLIVERDGRGEGVHGRRIVGARVVRVASEGTTKRSWREKVRMRDEEGGRAPGLGLMKARFSLFLRRSRSCPPPPALERVSRRRSRRLPSPVACPCRIARSHLLAPVVASPRVPLTRLPRPRGWASSSTPPSPPGRVSSTSRRPRRGPPARTRRACSSSPPSSRRS